MARGKNAEYIAELRRLVQLRPDYPYAELRLADALFAKGDLEEAKTHYLAALRVDPKQTLAYNNLGKLYLTQGQTSQAVAQFNEALRLNPDYKEAEENLRIAKGADDQVSPATPQ
jgi:superkiller protein 3